MADRDTADWRRFERLTAALRKSQDRGSEVQWNELLNGFRVDVSVRTAIGDRTHLEIIECRDHRRRVTQEQVAALVTKVQETGADFGTFVSAGGFQSGAIRLAEKRGIRLLKLALVPGEWPEPQRVIEVPEYRWLSPGVLLATGWLRFSHQQAAEARFTAPGGQRLNVGEMTAELVRRHTGPLDSVHTVDVELRPGWTLDLPGENGLHPQRFRVGVERFTRSVQVTCRYPNEIRPQAFSLTDQRGTPAAGGQVSDLPFGFDTSLAAGAFYRDVTGREYFCEAASIEEVVLVLLASRQHGGSLYGRLVQKRTDAGDHYARIVDAKSLARLRSEYQVFLDAEARGATVPGHALPTDLQAAMTFLPRPKPSTGAE
jgi:hypothetical protein